MRIIALLAPMLMALGLLTACGSGCAHGNHHHATGSSYDDAPGYTTSCTCSESGDIDCGQAALETSGGEFLN